MKLGSVYEEIISNMTSSAEYAGTAHEPILERFNAVSTILDPKLERTSDPRFVKPRTGLLEDNPMIIGGLRTGLVNPKTREELSGLVLMPFPAKTDQSVALLERSGRVSAIYDNTCGYMSFCEWNTQRNAEPKSREEIMNDLLEGIFASEARVGNKAFTIEAQRGLVGAEIAVRYLVETPNGFPLGFDL